MAVHSGGLPSNIERLLAQSGAASSHTGDTTETTLATITVPAGAMGKNGRVEIVFEWGGTTSASNKTLRVKFGGTTVYQSGQTTNIATRSFVSVTNRNATNSQVASLSTSASSFAATTVATTTAAIDTTAAVTILITGQCASGADTITLESYSARLLAA